MDFGVFACVFVSIGLTLGRSEGCDIYVTTNGTYIHSPSYPRYLPNLRCTYMMEAPEGHVIIVNFVEFATESSSTCAYDFLEFYDGRSTYSAYIGKFCGNRLPSTVTSSGRALTAKFQSDGFINDKGFKAVVTFSTDTLSDDKDSTTAWDRHGVFSNEEAVTTAWDIPEMDVTEPEDTTAFEGPECFIHVTTDGTKIQSPGYPNYESNQRCTYMMEAPEGHMISVNFIEFNTEGYRPLCRYDYLEFYDGESTASDYIGRHCGTSLPGPVTSSGSVLMAKFRSDNLFNRKGFEAIVTFSRNILTNYGESTTALNRQGVISDEEAVTTAWDIPGMQVTELEAQTAWQTPGCFIYVQKNETRIRSPSYPYYEPNQNCTYLLEAPKGYVVRVDFTEFAIEYTRGCYNDFLEFYDGSFSSSDYIGRYCGYLSPRVVTSSVNVLYAQFQSNDFRNSIGFEAIVTFIEGCFIYVQTTGTTIRSPSYPYYESNQKCIYLMEAPKGYVISVDFTEFALEYSFPCQEDYLQFYDGSSTSSPSIGRYCGYTTPNTVTSSANVLFAKFSSNRYINQQGFEAIVTFSEEKHSYDEEATTAWNIPGMYVTEPEAATTFEVPGCFIYVQKNGTIIRSPSYPYYESNQNCLYLLEAPKLYVVRVDFTHFSIEYTRGCYNDYLEFYDGELRDRGSIGRHCGYVLPHTIHSSANVLYAQFHSNHFRNQRGFEAIVTFSRVSSSAGLHWYEEDATTAWNVPETHEPEATTTFQGSECFIHVTTNGTEIQSPSYPYYESNQRCTYMMEAPEVHVISVNFIEFELEGFGCSYDYLQFYDGGSTTSDYIGTFCGYSLPSTVTSSGNMLMARFQSDGAIVKRGFKAIVTFAKDVPSNYGDYATLWNRQGVPSYGGDATTTWNKPGARSYDGDATTEWNIPEIHHTKPLDTIDFRRPGCFYYVRTNKEMIRSPSYPYYESNQFCLYLLEAPKGYVISVDFVEFSVEYSYRCNNDYLEFYDGPFRSSTLIGRHCGGRMPNTVTSSANMLYAEFYSNDGLNARGFEAIVTFSEGASSDDGGTTTAWYIPEAHVTEPEATTVSAECFFHVTRSNTKIRSPGYPQYSNNQRCTYLMEAPFGYEIIVEFNEFSVEVNDDCSYDYLQFYDGESLASPILGTFCGFEPPQKVTSSGNVLLAKFYSDASREERGFEATVTYYAASGKDNYAPEYYVDEFFTDVPDEELVTEPFSEEASSMTICDRGWTNYGDNQSYCFMASGKEWSSASRSCADIGGHLLKVEDHNENQFILTSMSNISLEFMWLGINDKDEEGVWITDDKRPASGYTNWDSWEPNNYYNEDCAIMALLWSDLRHGYWYDIPCCLEVPFICERK